MGVTLSLTQQGRGWFKTPEGRLGVSIPGRIALILTIITAGLALALQLSPWPSALLIRWGFDAGGWRSNALLASRVPAGISAQLDETYDPHDPDARLDVYYPAAQPSRVTVIWVHGGGFVSGSKGQIANYAKILAAGGHTVVAVDYSVAPAKTYPTPLLQVDRALDFLVHNAARLRVTPDRLVLAGDSAGAQIAAQLANIITSPTYARTVGVTPSIAPAQLAGVLLYCGPYAMIGAQGGGVLAQWFAHTVQWSYSGRRDYARDPRGATLAVMNFLTPQFPPTFISVGNADALAPQSYALADALKHQGVRVDALFFPGAYGARLPHEYQFSLATREARQALARSQEFLESLH